MIPANDVLQPMPPRVRGERSTETPRTQAAIDRAAACVLGVSVIARPGRWPGRHRLGTRI